MFKITRKKGFHIEFDNGFIVSVQFGPGDYCQNYDMTPGGDEEEAGRIGSADAECAVWGKDGAMIEYGDWRNTVGGRMEPADVLELMNWASKQ
jgi:hypothetical protein